MPKFSVKKPLTVFVAVLAIVVLGVVAYLKMTPDLMPNMDFPYVILVTTDPGASPETVEADITKPLEQSMATLDRIKNVTSSSMDSVSMVVLEFEDGVNMDTVSVDIQQKINQLKGSWSDTVGDPYVLKMNPSMLPVQVAALSYDGKDITQLSDFVNDTLSPKLEGITGVASVTVSGTPVELTYKEYSLLRLLLENTNLVVTRETILQVVWGTDISVESRTVDMHIRTLRKKLGDAGRYICTVRKVGYKLTDEEEAGEE